MSDKLDNPLGQMPLQAAFGGFDGLAFVISQALSKMQTATIVKIVRCTNNGGVSPVGLADVIPMVNQVDGNGKPIPHATIYNVPYLRIQGGSNAVIIDPEPGDIGIAVFASRDISRVKSTKETASPGSNRQYSFSDGMYLGGLLNGAPVQYVQFLLSGIVLHSPSSVTIEAPSVTIECDTLDVNAGESVVFNTPSFTINGAMFFNGPISAGGGSGETATFSGSVDVTVDVTAAGTSLHSHTHGGVQPGSGNTEGPN